MFWPTALVAMTTFLVVIDPIGTAAAGASLTYAMDPKEASRIYVKAIMAAFAICLAFGVAGTSLLFYTGISLSAFRVAGGLLLFVTGFRMLLGHPEFQSLSDKKVPYEDQGQLAIFPLAIPLTAGPGCITALLLLQSQATTLEEAAAVWSSLIINLLLTLVCFLMAHRLLRFLGPSPIQMAVKIMGLLLTAMAVQFIVDGVKTLFKIG